MDQVSCGSGNGTTVRGVAIITRCSLPGGRPVRSRRPRAAGESDRTAAWGAAEQAARTRQAATSVGERSTDEEGNRTARPRGRGRGRGRSGDVRRPRAVERQRVEPLGGAADQPGSAGRQHRPVRVRQPGRHEHGHDRRQLHPARSPAGGPNFPSFDDTVLYEIKSTTTGTAEDDLSYQFRFTTRRGTRTRSSTTRARSTR